MTQINKISVRHPMQYSLGEKVTCDFFPDQVFTIVSIQKDIAIVQGKSAVSRPIKLYRFHKA